MVNGRLLVISGMTMPITVTVTDCSDDDDDNADGVVVRGGGTVVHDCMAEVMKMMPCGGVGVGCDVGRAVVVEAAAIVNNPRTYSILCPVLYDKPYLWPIYS